MKTLITKTGAVSTLICLFLFLGTIQLNAQCSAGTTWTSIASQSNSEWSSVTYGNGLFVAVSPVGNGDQVMTSPDGITWTSRTSAAKGAGWTSVTYGNGLYVAVGHNSIMTSNDGISWTNRTSPVNLIWQSVTYGNGIFVAVSGSTVMTSTNGIVWTGQTVAGTWQCITYGNGLFVAVAHNNVMTSPDGKTWTSRTIAANNSWYSVTYGNGVFVAVSGSNFGNQQVMTSPDGITWTSRTAAANNDWMSVTYGNGLFVAVAYNGTGNRVMTSPNGITWTIRTSAADNRWMSVTYGNGVFVAVSETGTGNRVMTSTDGITWISRTTSAVNNNWFEVTYGNGLFVAVSTTGTGNRVMTSPDGINWRNRNSAANNEWQSVTYGNGLFVAVARTGTSNRVMTSPDGITWTIRTSAANNSWSSVTYGNGLFVAVASSGTGNRVMTSPNGITWTIRTSAANNEWQSVTYGNGLFVAVGRSYGVNGVMTSPDGITWTSRTAVDNSWSSVSYGNGVFVAVANNTAVMTSPDGITWTIGTGVIKVWTSVTYANGLFVAVSADGAVMTSPNGITWTSRTAAAGNSWQSVTHGNGIFVAVSPGGVMTSSPQLVLPSVSIAANSGNSITTGTSVTFTATPTNGGTTPTYQWKKNNNNVGANSDTYTDAALANGDIITCVLTSNDPCASPVTSTSTYIILAVSPVLPVLNQTFTSNGINYIVTKATLPYEVAVGSNTSFVGAATIPTAVSNSGYSFAVTSISISAFYGSGGLTSLSIPNTVTTIGDYCFGNCTSLTSIIIPNSVTSISGRVLSGCTGLSSVTIPNSVISIGVFAFENCTALTSVTIPNSVSSIGDGAFYNCSGLTSVIIPDSVTRIGNNAFIQCKGLTSITIPNSVSSIGDGVFFRCTGLTSLIIPNSVRSIGGDAFAQCTGLTSVTIPKSVTSIGIGAFGGCTGLTLFTVNWTTPLSVDFSVFSGVTLSTTTLNVPTGTATAYKNALVWKDFGTILQPVAAPVFTSFLPTTASTGTTVTITGTNFTGATAVSFGGTAATSFTVVNATTITAIVGGGASGNVSVTTSSGTAMLAGFTFCNPVTPIFAAASPICSGATLAALPTTSTNGITGTWSPALNNLATATYTFTPSAGQCANTTTLTITVNPSVTPTFTAVSPICSGATLAALPTTSNNAITGTWSPALNNLATTTYTFTPSVGQCATIAILAITVNTTTAPTAAAQILNTGSTVANLAATGNNLQWYSTISGGAALASTTVLSSGTYYVSQTLNGCESTRTSVAVTITIPRTLSFCSGSKLAEAVGTTSLKFYSALTGGTALVSTTTLTTRTYFATQMVNGIESTPRVAVAITANALPATPSTIAGTAAQGALVGTTTTATYSAADVFNAVSYIWTAPTGVNIVSGQGTNTVTVNFANVPAGAGAIGNLSVVAVNSNNCNSLVRSLALTRALPTAPSAIRMTDDLLPIPVSGPTAVTSFAQYMGTSKVLTLTATPSLTATSYEWELPAGVTQLSGGITNVITVNFAGVTSDNTYNYTTTATVPVTTYIVRIGVKAKNGTGVSVTANGSLLDPPTTSTARLLTLKAVLPTAPSAIKMTDALAVDPLRAVTVISNFIGTTKVFTLTATPSALASSYTWELPAGVNQLSGGNTNTITVNFANIASGTTSLYIGVKAVNGIGTSVTATNGTLVPATTSTARLLRLSATVPAAVTAVTGQIVGLCGGSTHNYTITPSILANTYQITAPMGALVKSASNMSNNSNVLTTPDLSFAVTYPAGFVATTAAPKTIAVAAVNGVGSSLTSRSTALSTLMPAVGVATAGTTFTRCTNQTFSIPTVVGATSYIWTVVDGAVIVSGQGNNSVVIDFSAVPALKTTNVLKVAAQNSCGVSSLVKSISLRSSSCSSARFSAPKDKGEIAESTTYSEVYPNPASDSFSIDILASQTGVLEMTIYAVNGAIVVSPKEVELKEGNNTITTTISSLSRGIYIVQFVNSSDNEVVTKKLIKE